MQCGMCKYWHEKKYYPPGPKPLWGLCGHLASGATDGIDFYTNNRDGEWIETTIETLPDWFCKEWTKKEEDHGNSSKV